MADWKVLSFYTANSAPGHGMDSLADNFHSGGDLSYQAYSCGVHSSVAQAFCTGTNISSCIGYLNQELQLLGISHLAFSLNGQPNICSLVNCCHSIFCLYRKTITTKEELENRIHRLSCERDYHKSAVVRSSCEHDALEKKLVQETNKFQQLSTKHKVIEGKVKSEKDEIKYLQSIIHHKDLKFKHDLRKKEHEMSRLKNKLHQLLMNKNPDQKVGMDLMKTIQNSNFKRTRWKPGLNIHEEEMYQTLIAKFETRHHDLLQENSDLRDCLSAMQRELSALLKKTADVSTVESLTMLAENKANSVIFKDMSDEGESDVNSHIDEINEGCYQMPCDLVLKDIKCAMQQTCRQICVNMRRTMTISSRVLHKMPPNPSHSNTKSPVQEMRHWQEQINKYKDIIEQQDHLLQQSLRTNSDSFLHDSQVLQDREGLAREKKIFYEEKTLFEEERRLLTEAAINLGRERKAVQEEKMRLIKDNLMSIAPCKVENAPSCEVSDGLKPILKTPTVSPLQQRQVKTPDVTEVFGAFGSIELVKHVISPSTLIIGINSTGRSTELDESDRGGLSSKSSLHFKLFSSAKSDPVDTAYSDWQ